MHAPPPFVSFRSVDDFLRSTGDAFPPEERDRIRHLAARGLPTATSHACIASLFGYSVSFVYTLAARRHRYYRNFRIRSGRKSRTIWSPKVALKVLQKWFATHLARAYEHHPAVYGFVPGRSPLQAAIQHCGADWVISLDIRDFFDNTPSEYLKRELVELGYSDFEAELLADLVTLYEALPQGAPSSPVCSNLAFRRLDERLAAIAEENRAIYTRYADDVTFSGAGRASVELIDQFDQILAETPWRRAVEKTHVVRRPTRLLVLGLVVNGDVPRLTKAYRRRLRAMQHRLDKGLASSAEKAVIDGHLAFSRSIETG